jgi:eukaryotic-like serine/threonine-protein kinase
MTDQKLGRFEIIREIGKGAMGVVYLAHDPRIDRKIAIKMIAIPPGISSQEAREARHRFVREAQAAGKLTHPNIITIYDVVEEADRSYIAMEYIDGDTLEAHTKPGALLPLEKVLAVIAQACSALDYAHQNKVIHRDIKPANLMLLKGNHLKITDFGLAKNPDANLTQDGVLIGTPNYMSPEQISGRPMDGRSDFFSLGVVLYELTTGERPFGGDTISTIIYRILYEEPRPPRILNEKLPPAFDQILRRALAKDPDDRFQTGAQFADALSNYSTHHLKRPVAPGAATQRVGGRQESPTAALRPRERARTYPRGVPSTATPMFAGQPFKVAAFIFIVILGLVLFPRRIHEIAQEDLKSAVTSKPVTQNQAGFSLNGLGATPAPAPPLLPPASGHEAKLITSQDTEVYLDGSKFIGTVVKISEGDSKEHELRAEQGCREASLLISASELKASYDLTDLKPKIADLTIDSKPPHALVYQDGKLLGAAPVTVSNYNACEKHTFMIRKENFQEWQRTFDEGTPWSEITTTLDSVSLSEIPSGYARFDPPPPYAVDVFLDNKKIAAKDGVVTLPEGNHSIVLKNSEVLYESTQKVSITGGKTLPLKVSWKRLGKLSIQAEPSNCRIFVDGVDLGAPPLLDQDIVAGDHEIKVIPEGYPDQAKVKTVTIEAGVTKVEKFAFNF